MNCKSVKTLIAAFILFALASASPSLVWLEAQEAKPRVAVIPVSIADKSNIQLNIISGRVTDTAGLILRFMSEYEYVKDPAPLSGYSREDMLAYCTREKIDNLVYGKAVQERDDSFTIEMSVFSRETGETTITRKGQAESALDIFSTTDRITFSLIEGFSGIHIAFGSIAITFTGDKGSFIPFIDGEEFPADTLSFKQVLTGERTVEIKQNRMAETVTIHTEKITVREGEAAGVSVIVPFLLEDEQEILSDYDKIIEKNRGKTSRKDRVADAYNKIDSLLYDTPYNPKLSELRDKYRNDRAEWERELASRPVLDKREIIIGVHYGSGNSKIREKENDGEVDNPIEFDEVNDQDNTSPVIGFFLEYQILNNISLRTEINQVKHVFQEEAGVTEYIKTTEIPLILKYMYKTRFGRFGLLLGLYYQDIYETEGNINSGGEMPGIYNYDIVYNGVGTLIGLEYSYKIKRHVFSLGLRATSASILEYEYSPEPEKDGYFNLATDSFEILLGYGYNIGGKGDKILTDEKSEKWLFPVHAGSMFMTYDKTFSSLAAGGVLYRFTGTGYFGITGFVFEEGAAPLLTAAWTKDPDYIINSVGFIIVPMQDMIIVSGMYSFAWKRFSIGALFGGPLETITEDGAWGLVAGYYF